MVVIVKRQNRIANHKSAGGSMRIFIVVLWALGLFSLIASFTVGGPYTSGLTVLFWSFPADWAAGSTLGERL